MDSRQLSVIKTLSYSDVFNYPLSFSEIHYFLESDNPLSSPDLKRILRDMSSREVGSLEKANGYYAFLGKKELITKRIRGEHIVQAKIVLGRKIARTLMTIPSVLFIGISGRVAGGGAAESDDIDFFVITRSGTLYVTRFLLLLLLELLGRRRRRGQISAKDTICLNMLIDKPSLLFKRPRQDLYTAREIVQIIPLFERNDTYAAFLKANSWTRNLLPYAIGKSGLVSLRCHDFLNQGLVFIEPLLRLVQVWKMRQHGRSEIIEQTVLAFHPNDQKECILTEYEKRLRHYIKCYTRPHQQ